MARDVPDHFYTAALIAASRPKDPDLHLSGRMVLAAETAALYALPETEVAALADALAKGQGGAALARLGLTLAPATPPVPEITPGPVLALALTVSQSCNLACGYCYASGGSFGGPETRMDWPVAQKAIDRLIGDTPPGGSVKIAFMGGEPMLARDLIRQSVDHANRRAAARAVSVGFSITTNGTLLRDDDAEFLARHRFAVTVSLDGAKATNDRLRPLRGGQGSFALVARGLAPLVARADRISLSARVTVTPDNLDLAETVGALADLGFQSVGASPMINAPTGKGTLQGDDFHRLLAAMVECGQDWLTATLAGRAHPFANLATALTELHRGKVRSHGCGAARDYLSVDASGSYSACHRFVNDPLGRMGDLVSGIDDRARADFLTDRQVEAQEACSKCWARRLCGGGCHQEVLHVGRPACDFVRGWLHFAISAYDRMMTERPDWFDAIG